MYAQAPIAVLTDRAISDAARTLLLILVACSHRHGKVRLTTAELLELSGRPEKVTRRHLGELKGAGYLSVRRLNYQDFEYTPLAKALVRVPQAPVRKVGAIPAVCDECKKLLPTTSEGICVACCRERREVEAYARAKAELPAGASHERISAKVLVNKASKRLERARREVDRGETAEAEWLGPDEVA